MTLKKFPTKKNSSLAIDTHFHVNSQNVLNLNKSFYSNNRWNSQKKTEVHNIRDRFFWGSHCVLSILSLFYKKKWQARLYNLSFFFCVCVCILILSKLILYELYVCRSCLRINRLVLASTANSNLGTRV